MDNQHNHHHQLEISPLLVGLWGVIAGAIIVAICHCIIVLCNGTPMQRPNRTTTNFASQRQNSYINGQEGVSRASDTVEHTTVQVVVESKYSKELKEDLCAVCLGEFKEGEGVRVLPECTHVFHMLCIDKWLNNHYNCPLCRANAIPPSRLHVTSLSDSGDGQDI
ncbi:hypothetical protein BUALT_Bualt09G0110400 [Buddleja alternifolia]|uniref:RING-type E3 ubiquitin transferase n=1 Tax=Buddleja alternifolia TaxID=168488 RepID=A0AAV6XCF8_9LAMI|nr:hypothetical protein BUALT_Bualt09G0110400 [Buddleja alternifolia]